MPSVRWRATRCWPKRAPSSCASLGLSLSDIMELSPDANSVSLAAGVGFRLGVRGTVAIPAGKGTQADFSMAAGGVVIVDDLATERRFVANRLLLEHGARSGMAVRIGAADDPFGTITAFTGAARTVHT